MKLTGIFVLALVLASAVVAQQVAAEPLEEIKFKIVIGKMTQEPMFESVGFLKILKIAKKLAPLVVRENQTLDELKWKVIITKLAQEEPETFKPYIPVRPFPKETPEQKIHIHIVIGKMAQESQFEQLSFGKVIKIAKKIAPLVLSADSQSVDQLKWKVIITKLSQETAILEAGSQEQNAKDVIKKIINGIIHFIVKSEAPLEQWKIIISKATEQPETLAPAVDTKETNIITKLLKKVIIIGVIHWISTRATNESLVAKKEVANIDDLKQRIMDAYKKIINYLKAAKVPVEQWKIIISKLSEEQESFKPVIPKFLKAESSEKSAKDVIKKIINGIIHFIVKSEEPLDQWKIIISKLEEEANTPLRAEPAEKSAKDVIKKIINGIIQFIVKSDAPLEQWKIIISKATEQPETLAPSVDANETNIITKLLKKVIINGVIHWISTRATNESVVSKKPVANTEALEKNIKDIFKKIINFIVKSEVPLDQWKIIISKMTQNESALRPLPIRPIRPILKAESAEKSAKDVIKKIINGIIHFIVKTEQVETN